MSPGLVGTLLLQQFRVDAFVASGGMGAVYRVWDLERNVPLAMKVLHADLAEDPSLFKRFEREARALRKLAHPNIVPFYGLYHTLDITFLLERYIDGPTLKEVLRQRGGGPLGAQEALAYLDAVTSALGYAHAQAVVHCDVKPGNVMVDRGGQVYLTDFGVARHAESTTTTIGYAGTAAYMAPEQCRGEAVSAATDVYALGVMLYEMIVGERPFRGNEAGTESGGTTAGERIRWAHLHLPAPKAWEVNAQVSKPLGEVIAKALAKSAGERWESARGFYDAACGAVGQQPEEAVGRAVGVPSAGEVVLRDGQALPFEAAGTTPPRQRAFPWIAGGAGISVLGGLCVMGALAGVLIFGSRGEDRTGDDLATRAARTVAVELTGMAASSGEIGGIVSPASTPAWAGVSPTPAGGQAEQPWRTETPIPGSPWRPDADCASSRIRVGNWTRVGLEPPIPNRIRSEPGGDTIGYANPGTVLHVLGGPVCDDGLLFWRVRSADGGLEGWTAEVGEEGYWYLDPGSLEPP